MNTATHFGPTIVRSIGFAALMSVTFAQSSLVGTWTGVQVLEPAMVSASPPEPPVVACDALGHAVSVWTSPSMGVVFTERYPGGTWSPVHSILPGVDGYAPQVAIGSTGMVAASWVTPGQELIPPKLVVSVRAFGGGFGVPTQLAAGGNLFDSRLGVSRFGAVTIVWTQGGVVHSATRNRAGTWSPVQTLSAPDMYAGTPELVVNPNGAAVAVWPQGTTTSPGTPSVGVAFRSARSDFVWNAPMLLSGAPGQPLYTPKVVMDAAGDVAVGYIEGHTLMLVTKSVGAAWGVPFAVSSPKDNVYATGFAMDAWGNVLATWQALDMGNYGTVSKRTAPAGGPLGPVMVLSTVAEDASAPMVSLATDGSVGIVTWVDNTTFAARAATAKLRGPVTVSDIGMGWWNTPIPVAAGSLAVSAVWNAPTANPNVTLMVGNVFLP